MIGNLRQTPRAGNEPFASPHLLVERDARLTGRCLLKTKTHVAVVSVVGILLLMAQAPHADARTEVQPANTSAFVFLGESRGYEVGISMPTSRVAVLSVFKAEEDSPEAFWQSVYGVRVASGALEKGVIRARFPSLGAISMRFHPSGKERVHRAQRNCRGKRRVTEYGTFRGAVSLEGEDGYFSIKTRSARGLLERSFRSACRGGSAKQLTSTSLWDYVDSGFESSYSPGSGTAALLYAVDNHGERRIGVRAAHREGSPPGADVQVSVLEARNGMAIGRSAVAGNGVPGTLTTSMPGVHPAFATLKPPSPFYGEGSFYETSSISHSWSGTLGVSLPGLDLPLTGDEFKTSLCVVSPLKAPSGCDFIKPEPLR